MNMRHWTALLVFSVIVFLLAYPFVAADGKGEPKLSKTPIPEHSFLTRLRPQFAVPGKKPGKIEVIGYSEYLSRSRIDSKTVMSEEEVVLLAREGYGKCKAALAASKRGAPLADALHGFYKAPDPLGMATAASTAFFVVGAIVLLILGAAGQRRPRAPYTADEPVVG